MAVVFPVHNEKRTAIRLCRSIRDFLDESPAASAVIVDDGSNDGSADLFQSEVAGHPRVMVVCLPVNRGKGHAVRTAVERISAERILFMDGDLAYSLKEIPRMVHALDEHDVVIGSRSMAPQARGGLSVRRAVFGWGFNRLACALFQIDYPDTQAGFKGFRREAAKKIFSKQRINGFAFDAEILFLSKKLGLQVGEIPVQVTSEHSYKNSQMKLALDSFRCIADFFRVLWWATTGGYRFS